MKRLKGKCALITGAAAGIGFQIAQKLGDEGASLAILDINLDRLKAAEKQLESKGFEVTSLSFDVSAIETHESIVETIEKEFHPIDILINNAGITNAVPITELNPMQWDILMNINLRGTFFLTQVVFIRMKQRGWGRVVSMGSISGERGARMAGAHYSISKAGIIMMTKVFALSAADCGITFNTVSPGIIDTEMTALLGTQIVPDDVPLNRMGDPSDIANTIAFLVTDEANYLTGQNISVNGGQSMR